MPQIYEGLVQRGERLPEMFQAGLERGRGERRRRDLGALMSAGNLDKASAYAFQEGLLDQGLEIQGMAADRAQSQQAAEDERRDQFTGILQDVAPALARASQIEDEAQRGEAIATITATTAQMYPQLAGEIEQYGEQLYNMPREQLQFAAEAMGYEAQGGDLTTFGQQLVEAGYQPGTPQFQQAMRERIQRGGQQINVNLPSEGDGQPIIRSGAEASPDLDPNKTYQLREGAGGSRYWEEISLSPAAQEEAAEAQNAAQREAITGAARDTSNLLEDVNAVLAQTNDDTTGFAGWLLGTVPGMPQFDYGQQLEAIKGRIALETLDQMRAEAAAQGNRGSGLGQVTEREIRILQATRGALEQAQSADEVRRVLTRLSNDLSLVDASRQIVLASEDLGLARSVYGRDIGEPGNPFRPQTNDDYDAIPAGMVFLDPDSGELLRKPTQGEE